MKFFIQYRTLFQLMIDQMTNKAKDEQDLIHKDYNKLVEERKQLLTS